MTYRWRGRSTSELFAAITFAGFLAGFLFYLCVGNFQRAKSAAQRQARRRRELEEQKRKRCAALTSLELGTAASPTTGSHGMHHQPSG